MEPEKGAGRFPVSRPSPHPAPNYGYNTSVYYIIEKFHMLRECFARQWVEVSLECLATAPFPADISLYEGADPPIIY